MKEGQRSGLCQLKKSGNLATCVLAAVSVSILRTISSCAVNTPPVGATVSTLVPGCAFRVSGWVFRVWGFGGWGFEGWDFELGVWGLECGLKGLGFRVWGLGFRV